MFETKSENCDFLKTILKDFCYFTLKSYSLHKFEKKLSEAESVALESLIERKSLVIHKPHKVNAVVVTEHNKHLQGIKFLLSDSSKFIQPPINEGK